MTSVFRSVNLVNILFLDVDEVLNCNVNRKSDKQHKNVTFLGINTHDRFHPLLVENVNKLIKRYDLKIVVSSTWRKHFDIITLRDIFKNQLGIVGDVLDYTTQHTLDHEYRKRIEWEGDAALPRDRGLQITHWLLDKKYNVKDYIVLDDSLDASYGHEDKYHRTFGTRGFDQASYDECIAKFDNVFLNNTL